MITLKIIKAEPKKHSVKYTLQDPTTGETLTLYWPSSMGPLPSSITITKEV